MNDIKTILEQIANDLLELSYDHFKGPASNNPEVVPFYRIADRIKALLKLIPEPTSSGSRQNNDPLEPLNIYNIGISHWVRHREINKEKDFPIRELALKLNTISHNDDYVWVTVAAKDIDEARLIRKKMSKALIAYLWDIPFNSFEDVQKCIDDYLGSDT